MPGLFIPPELEWLFWGADVRGLDAKHKKYIIERVLEFGNEAAYRWLFRVFSREDIVAVVKTSSRIFPQDSDNDGQFL